MTNPIVEALSKSAIVIRDLASIEELRQVPEIEKEVWAADDRDAIPVLLLIAAREAGSILVGAFEGEKLIGFAFGFPALEHGHVSIHSHMAAVLPQYRNLNLGYKLKLAQRERALAMRLEEITWTFDPLQARNAHFNFAKLGVLCDRYKVDFYGRESTSALHQNGTDRLWVSWQLNSARVQERLRGASPESDIPSPRALLVRCDQQARPVRDEGAELDSSQIVGIEIPADIDRIEESDAALAWDWRLATRWAFTQALKSGFFVAEFLRGSSGQHGGTYILQKGSAHG